MPLIGGQPFSIITSPWRRITGPGGRLGTWVSMQNTGTATVNVAASSVYPPGAQDPRFQVCHLSGGATSEHRIAREHPGPFTDTPVMPAGARIVYWLGFLVQNDQPDGSMPAGMRLGGVDYLEELKVIDEFYSLRRDVWDGPALYQGFFGNFRDDNIWIANEIMDWVNQGFTVVDLIRWFRAQNPGATPAVNPALP